MSEIYQRLAHSSWDCKYHVVIVPKRRRKVLFGQARRKLGEIFHALARQKECQILEGHLLPDHVHMCIAIPPKYPVASVIGFLKGKSAIAMARLCGKERNFTGEHFWARGYAVSTVGFELEQVRKYIREQESADGNSGGFKSHRPKRALARRVKSTGQPPLRRPHSPSHPLRGGCLTLGGSQKARSFDLSLSPAIILKNRKMYLNRHDS